MKSQLDEEKELLIMKGEALRMRLEALNSPIKKGNSTNVNNILSLVSSSLEQPIVRSLAMSLLSSKLFTTRNLLWSGLGLLMVLLLDKDSKK
ncbi:MAG: hypothetical protein Q4B95_06570 [Lonepinella koalarum]|nr:hypothetical protein [Lonepinella koalarum]